MPDLHFAITGAEAVPYAAAPLLALKLRITSSEPLGGAMLRCQVQLDPTRRRHEAGERERLADLFGPAAVWDRAVRPLHWAQLTVLVPAFDHEVVVDLEVPCSHDLSVAASRYLDGLDGGAVSVRVLFSGSIFGGAGGALQILPVPWNCEATFDLPVATWKELLAHYYPNAVFVGLRRDLYDQLRAIQSQSATLTLEHVLEGLLAKAKA